MNRSDRRNNKTRAAIRLRQSKAYCLITFDGKSLPVFHYDMTACEDHDDVRHIAMHAAAEAAISRLAIAQAAVEKKAAVLDQAEKVEEAKEKRGEELLKENPTLADQVAFYTREKRSEGLVPLSDLMGTVLAKPLETAEFV